MSATILFQQENGQRLKIDCPSIFIQQLRDAFSDGMEWTLTPTALEKLSGMAACNKDFEQVINAIEQLGTIRLWVEY